MEIFWVLAQAQYVANRDKLVNLDKCLSSPILIASLLAPPQYTWTHSTLNRTEPIHKMIARHAILNSYVLLMINWELFVAFRSEEGNHS
jgi:hypothetical protein